MKIYRKRYIPDEIVDISSDKVIYKDEKLIITEWVPIKPRKDIARGVSYAMLNKGWKISKFFEQNDEFIYWYCDIIEHMYDEENDTYTLIDLLVDLKIFPDGTYEVLDLEELDEALEKGIITIAQKEDALNKLNELLELVKKGEFPAFSASLEKIH